uniref:RRM domain-containing protein n=1 Tax=Heterosigma akashiwo TaxID=2829 RepID=A0A7S3XN27_HETAK
MSDERPERSNDVTGKLFLGGVSWQTTEDGLKFYFEKFGKLKDCAVMKDKFTGQPRGFGFVQFEDASAVDKVLAEEHTIDGRVLDIKKAISREHAPRAISEKIDVKKIFVGGLEQAVTEGDFKDYFGKFGDITDAVVMMDRNTNRSRGFGFVTYADAVRWRLPWTSAFHCPNRKPPPLTIQNKIFSPCFCLARIGVTFLPNQMSLL